MITKLITPKGMDPDPEVINSVKMFLSKFKPHEVKNGSTLVLFFDEKSKAYYLVCHLTAKTLKEKCDLEASLDGSDEDDIYKLNRDITEDQLAYKRMQEDAAEGRSFEDMVVEYDIAYRATKPLKVYGGQHRLQALLKTNQKESIVHGVRVYFALTREQKVEIATVNNTSIAVPNDLIDRMREQLLGSELRDWCQSVGLLGMGEDFADRKSPEDPTVRVARTLLVNFYKGLDTESLDQFHQPIICKSGANVDELYMEVRKRVNWSDPALLEMGKEFARLHQIQRERVSNRKQDTLAEYARKALSLAVVSSWSYAAGLFQKDSVKLASHYRLPEYVSAPDDPLNGKGLSQARHKIIDPETYRGLGARNHPTELGRMLEVFLVSAAKKKKITKDLANAAIQSYEAKRATYQADKALRKI